MAHFTLTLTCKNAAFADADSGEITLESASSEVADILRNAAGMLELGGWAGYLVDSNGNTVGEFHLASEDSA